MSGYKRQPRVGQPKDNVAQLSSTEAKYYIAIYILKMLEKSHQQQGNRGRMQRIKMTASESP